jgi:hypothetical protein
LLVDYNTRDSSLDIKDLAAICSHNSVSARGISGFLGTCLWLRKFRFLAAAVRWFGDRFESYEQTT